jgi:hypothetical protein
VMEGQVVSSDVQSPSPEARCSVTACPDEVAAHLETKPMCVEHFLKGSVSELETRSAKVKGESYDSVAIQSFKELLSECAKEAQRLADYKSFSNHDTKRRLLEVVTRASHLSQQLRRSLRVPASMSVWLRREDPGRTWEEETWTSSISRHGAGLVCRHFVEPGGTLVVCRKGLGERARARVVYCRYDGDGRRQIGVEFLDRNDFWDSRYEASRNGAAASAVPSAS